MQMRLLTMLEEYTILRQEKEQERKRQRVIFPFQFRHNFRHLTFKIIFNKHNPNTNEKCFLSQRIIFMMTKCTPSDQVYLWIMHRFYPEKNHLACLFIRQIWCIYVSRIKRNSKGSSWLSRRHCMGQNLALQNP